MIEYAETPQKFKNKNATYYSVPNDVYWSNMRNQAQYIVNYSEWICDVWYFYINDLRTTNNWTYIYDQIEIALQTTHLYPALKLNLPDLRQYYEEAYNVLRWMGTLLCNKVGGHKMFPYDERQEHIVRAMDEKIPYKQNLPLMVKLSRKRADKEDEKFAWIYNSLQFRCRNGSPRETFTSYIQKMAKLLDDLDYNEACFARQNVFPIRLAEGLANFPRTQSKIKDVSNAAPYFYSNEEMVSWYIEVVT